MKYYALLILFTLWLFAIVAPSVITLMDVDNPILVTSLNEEEQQKSGKKSPSEEKIISEGHFDFSLIAQSRRAILGDYYPIGHIDHTIEILLPPPEQIS